MQSSLKRYEYDTSGLWLSNAKVPVTFTVPQLACDMLHYRLSELAYLCTAGMSDSFHFTNLHGTRQKTLKCL